MLSCDNEDEGIDGQSWLDNPTSLVIGDSPLNHHMGAVVGNWAVLGGITIIWKGVATFLKDKKTMYPGGLIIPVAFLFAPTVTSSTTLISKGTPGQRFLGVSSLCGQVIGLGFITMFLLPKNFHATLAINLKEHKKEWADVTGFSGYVNRYVIMFDDYRPRRQWFISPELSMSLTTGLLKSYQITGGDCATLLSLSAVNSIVYVTSLVFLRPYRESRDKIFFIIIGGLQAAALSTQAVASWISEDALEKVTPITETVVMITEWALLGKSLYDIYNRLQDFYQSFVKSYSRIPNSDLDKNLLEVVRVIHPSENLHDIEMRSRLYQMSHHAEKQLGERVSKIREIFERSGKKPIDGIDSLLCEECDRDSSDLNPKINIALDLASRGKSKKEIEDFFTYCDLL